MVSCQASAIIDSKNSECEMTATIAMVHRKRGERKHNKMKNAVDSSSSPPSSIDASLKYNKYLHFNYKYYKYTIALKAILTTTLLFGHVMTIGEAKINWSYNNHNHNHNHNNHHHHRRLSLLLKNIETRMNREFRPPSVPLFTSTTSVPFSIPHLNLCSRSFRERSASDNNNDNDSTGEAVDDPYNPSSSNTDTLVHDVDNANNEHGDTFTISNENDPTTATATATATPKKAENSSSYVHVNTCTEYEYVTNTARGGSSIDSTTSSSEEHNNDGYTTSTRNHHNRRHPRRHVHVHGDTNTNEINNYYQHDTNESEGEGGDIGDTDNIEDIEDLEDDLEEDVEEYNMSSSYDREDESGNDTDAQFMIPSNISLLDSGDTYNENYRNDIYHLDARADTGVIDDDDREDDDTDADDGDDNDNDDNLSVYDMTEELFQEEDEDVVDDIKLDLNLHYDNDDDDDDDIFIHHQADSSIEVNDLNTDNDDDDEFLHLQQENEVENEEDHDHYDINYNIQNDDAINDGIADNSHNIIIDTIVDDDDDDDHSDISDGGFFRQGGEENNEEEIISVHEEEQEERDLMDELEELEGEEEVEVEQDTKALSSTLMEYVKEGQEEGGAQENIDNDGDNDNYNYNDDGIISQGDHSGHGGMNEVIYEEETITNSNHDDHEVYSGDLIEDRDHEIDLEGEDVHEDIAMNDVMDGVIDDVDYPSGSDSATFVDRMDLADAYDDGIFTDIMGGDTDIAEEYPVESTSSNIQGINMNIPNIVPADTGPTVQYIITENMRRCLIRKLGYSPMEVSHMKADVAAVVVSKMLKRPNIGMPSEFYIDGTAPVVKRRAWGTQPQKIIRQAILPAIMTGISLYCGKRIITPKMATDNDEEEVAPLKNSKVEAQISPRIPANISMDDEIKNHSSSTSKGDVNDDISSPSSSFSKVPSKPAKKKGDAQLPYEPTLMKRRKKPPIVSVKEQIKIIEEPIAEDVLEEDEVIGTLVEDPDKSLIDKAITFTLEKIDEVFKRPF